MENWIWFIIAYILQTFFGAVLWRKYGTGNGEAKTANEALVCSMFVITNIIGICIVICLAIGWKFNKVLKLIDYLAGKNKGL